MGQLVESMVTLVRCERSVQQETISSDLESSLNVSW